MPDLSFTPDPEPRDTSFHKKIVKSIQLRGFKNGHKVELDCGHTALIFGDINRLNGVALCDQCQQVAMPTKL